MTPRSDPHTEAETGRFTDRAQFLRDQASHIEVTGQPSPGCVATLLREDAAILAAAEARVTQLVSWLDRQLTGCAEDADTIATITDLALARALASNIRDAHSALGVVADGGGGRDD